MNKADKKEKESKNKYYKPSFVADNIQKIRNIRGFTLQEVADSIERDYSTYEQIERGMSTQVEVIMAIAQKLDVSVDFILKNEIQITEERVNAHPYYNCSYMMPNVEIETTLTVDKD